MSQRARRPFVPMTPSLEQRCLFSVDLAVGTVAAEVLMTDIPPTGLPPVVDDANPTDQGPVAPAPSGDPIGDQLIDGMIQRRFQEALQEFQDGPSPDQSPLTPDEVVNEMNKWADRQDAIDAAQDAINKFRNGEEVDPSAIPPGPPGDAETPTEFTPITPADIDTLSQELARNNPPGSATNPYPGQPVDFDPWSGIDGTWGPSVILPPPGTPTKSWYDLVPDEAWEAEKNGGLLVMPPREYDYAYASSFADYVGAEVEFYPVAGYTLPGM